MNELKVYELGQAYIRLDFNANAEFKESFEKYLLFKGKQYANEVYHKELLVDGFYFIIELEEGSLKSRLKIFGKIAIAVLIGYGEIRKSIDYLIKDSQTVTELITRDLSKEPNIGKDKIGRVERRLGVPGKLKRLYSDIDRLNKDRNNLTENEQQELIEKIGRQFNELILELDQPEIKIIMQELNHHQIPIPKPKKDFDFYLPNKYAIKEEEIKLISEGEIKGTRKLPPRQ